MAYKRNYRRRTYKKRPVSRGKVYRAAGTQLWKDVKMLKGLINTEFKTKDMVASTTISSAGSGILLNGLVKGDDYNNREGRQIRMKSLQLSIRVTLHASATSTNLRWFLILDKQPNAAGWSMSDILDTSVAGGIDAFRELSTRKRFVHIAQGRIYVDTDDPSKMTSRYKKVDIKTVYDASDAGDITDITTNSLYLFMVSDQGTNVPTVVYNHRLRFLDN